MEETPSELLPRWNEVLERKGSTFLLPPGRAQVPAPPQPSWGPLCFFTSPSGQWLSFTGEAGGHCRWGWLHGSVATLPAGRGSCRLPLRRGPQPHPARKDSARDQCKFQTSVGARPSWFPTEALSPHGQRGGYGILPSSLPKSTISSSHET